MAANPPRDDPEMMGAVPFPEGADREETPENSLLMEDVLDNVLGYLDFDSLRQSRVVSPLWNLAGGRLLSPRCGPIKFLTASELDYRRNGRGITDMGQLVSLLNTSWNFPCTKFIVSCGIATTPEEEQILTSFFQLVGPAATELEILHAEATQQLFRGPQPQGIEYMALKSLTVTFSLNSVSENLQSNMTFLGNVLDHAPNLRCLHLQTFRDNNREVVTFAVTLLERVNCSKIRDFTIHGDISDHHLNKILDLGVTNLQKLHLVIAGNAMVNSMSLQNFLERQGQSLETFHLETYDFKREVFWEMPRLPKLKKLTVQGFYSYETMDMEFFPLSFSGVSYKHQFPVLKSLTIVENFDKNLKEFVDDYIQPAETVEELALPEDEDDEDVELEPIVRNAARIFPKLRKLKAPSQSRVMRPAYEAFGCVEELTLFDGTYYDDHEDFQSVDSLLTQFTEEECNQARNSPERLTELIERNTEPLPFLKRLKVLKIIQQNGERGFSDVSCRVILLKLDGLKSLKLVGTFSDRVLTEPVIREMKEKFRVEFERRD